MEPARLAARHLRNVEEPQLKRNVVRSGQKNVMKLSLRPLQRSIGHVVDEPYNDRVVVDTTLRRKHRHDVPPKHPRSHGPYTVRCRRHDCPFQRLVEVSNDIIDMLNPNTEPNHLR